MSKTTGLGMVNVDASDGEPAGRLAIIDCGDTGYADVCSYTWLVAPSAPS